MRAGKFGRTAEAGYRKRRTGGPPDSTRFPAGLIVVYVRVTQP